MDGEASEGGEDEGAAALSEATERDKAVPVPIARSKRETSKAREDG
jgi:hypothetical protein